MMEYYLLVNKLVIVIKGASIPSETPKPLSSEDLNQHTIYRRINGNSSILSVLAVSFTLSLTPIRFFLKRV